jgi:hypothetical protein
LAAFALLSLAHLLATRQALGHVVLKHVTPARAELLAAQFGRQIMQTKRAGGGMHKSAAQTLAAAHFAPSSHAPFCSSPSQPSSSVPSLSFHLSPPAVLQRSEPLFFRLRRSAGLPTLVSDAVATDTAAAVANQSDLSEPSSSVADAHELAQRSSSTSLHTQSSFERLWRAVSQQPRVNDVVVGHDENATVAEGDVESPLEAHRGPVQLHERWLAQFDALPFVAALQIVDPRDVSLASSQGAEEMDEQLDKAASVSFFSRVKTRVTTLWSRWQHKLQSSRGSYAVLTTADSPSASSSPPPHLRILLLHKQGASAEQLLLSSLYTSHLRRGWAAAAARTHPRQADSCFSPEATEILLRDLHRDALALMRLDATAAGAPPLMDILDRAAAVSAATSTEAPSGLAPPTTSIPAAVDAAPANRQSVVPPLPHASHFVHALRVAGYHTAAHFVEDDNPVRIHLARPVAHH